MKYIYTILFLFVVKTNLFAQINDTKIEIINSDKIQVNTTDSFKYVIGNPAIIKQGTTLFKADSIYISDKLEAKFIEAFGKVYINESDSVITTARYLKYYTDKKLALLKNDVYIKSSGGTFTSNEVEYDLNTKKATYNNYAKIVSKRSVLTSKAGEYYSNTKDALFTNDVVLNGPEYDVKTDTLYYNVNTEIANFVTFTKVLNKAKKQTIETTRGFYDMKKGVAKFTERSQINDNGRIIKADNIDMDQTNKIYSLLGAASIVDKEKTIKANSIFIDEKNDLYKLNGKASIVDKEKQETYRGEIIDINKKTERYHIEQNGLYKNEKEGFVITGNYLDGDGKSGKFFARGKPVAIIKQENDSIFIAADTLYSGKIWNNKKLITDSLVKVTSIDTIKNKQEVDSAKRYFEAFHHVRIFSDSAQAVCDSLYYSDVDSVFRLYQQPIVWNDKNQISGDTIYLFTKNKKVERAEVFEKGFIINIVEPKFYNQIRANKITSYFFDGNMDSLHAKGSAEIIFYIQDEDKGFVGVDKSSAAVINAYFKNKEIYKLKWLNKYDGTTTPMKSVDHQSLRLRYFNLQFDKRPKSKFELFF